MRIELHPEADAEFAAQVDYYDRKQPGLGERFYREVIACFDHIAVNPTLARLRKNYRRVKSLLVLCRIRGRAFIGVPRSKYVREIPTPSESRSAGVARSRNAYALHRMNFM